jgi:hypothetical protein
MWEAVVWDGASGVGILVAVNMNAVQVPVRAILRESAIIMAIIKCDQRM